MKVCIFDLDGTLTNTLPAIAHFGNTALTECGFKAFPDERYKIFVGDGRDKLIERMLEAQGSLTEENFKRVCAVYDRYYEADPLYKTDVYDGIRSVLEKLKENGFKIAVCSNKPDNVAQDVIRIFFGEGYFDCVYGVKEGRATKPNPECALNIINILGAKKVDCVFIGDTNVDIRTGKNAGITTIGVLWGFRDRAELAEAGADYIIEKPSEILDILRRNLG